MNKIFSAIVFTVFLLGYSIAQNKQQYKYDLAGNRNLRNVCTGCRMVQQAPGHKSDSLCDVKTAMSEGISLFPNPTLGGVTVSIAKYDPAQPTKLYVIDAAGKIMMAQDVTANEAAVDLSKLMQGIYYVRVVKGGKELVYKVIKVQ